MNKYIVPEAVLNVAYGNNGDYGPMPCKDSVYRIPTDWIKANAKRFHFTDEQIINAAVTKFDTPNLPKLARCFGIYFLISNKRIIYVGQSTDIDGRIFKHKKNGVPFDSFSWFEAPELHLKQIEAYYINRIQPPLNADYPCDDRFSLTAQQFDTAPPKPRTEQWIIVKAPYFVR